MRWLPLEFTNETQWKHPKPVTTALPAIRREFLVSAYAGHGAGLLPLA